MASTREDKQAGGEWERRPELIEDVECELKKIERRLILKAEALEKSVDNSSTDAHLTNESLSIRASFFNGLNRVFIALRRHDQAEERILKENTSLKERVKAYEYERVEMQMERDVLLQQIHSYLEVNSSLRVRLEEQRCRAGTGQGQLNSATKNLSLGGAKQKSQDFNPWKEKQFFVMNKTLEQSAYPKDTEIFNGRNGEFITMKIPDLQKVITEKTEIEEKICPIIKKTIIYECSNNENGDNFSENNRNLIKRWSSTGDINLNSWNFPKQKFLPKFSEMLPPDSNICTPQMVKGWEMNSEEEDLPLNIFCKCQYKEEFSDRRSTECVSELKEGETVDDLKKKESPRLSLHTQLNALKRGLYDVARKLEKLKHQLITSGIIPDENHIENQRNLKRKAKSLAVQEMEGNESEESKLSMQSLKNILDDAKNLNVKLQILREVKQRTLGMKVKVSGGIQLEANKKDAGCEFPGVYKDIQWPLQGVTVKFSDSLRQCAKGSCGYGIAPSLPSWPLRKLWHLPERKLTGNQWFWDETNENSSTGPPPKEEEKTNAENGGGDNLFKKGTSDATASSDKQIQIARPQSKLRGFPELRRRISGP